MTSPQYLVHRSYTKAAAALVSEAPGISVRRASGWHFALFMDESTFAPCHALRRLHMMSGVDFCIAIETHHDRTSTCTLASRSMLYSHLAQRSNQAEIYLNLVVHLQLIATSCVTTTTAGDTGQSTCWGVFSTRHARQSHG